MLVLNDTGIGDIVGSVVDYRVALIVGCVLCASFERDCAPVELAILVIEEFVDASGVRLCAKYVNVAPKRLEPTIK